MTGPKDPEIAAAVRECLTASQHAASAEPTSRVSTRLDAAERLIELDACREAEDVLRQVLAEDASAFPPPPGERHLTVEDMATIRLAELQERTGWATGACESWERVGASLLKRGEPALSAEILVMAATRLASIVPEPALALVHLAFRAMAQAGPSTRSAELLHAAGYAAHLCGDGAAAVRLHEEALLIARNAANDELADTLVQNLVALAHARGDLRQVVRYGKRAASAAARRGAVPAERTALLGQYAAACAELGRSEEALVVLEVLEADTQQMPSAVLSALLGLHAQVLVDLKRHDEALSLLSRLDMAGGQTPSEVLTIRRRISDDSRAPWRLD